MLNLKDGTLWQWDIGRKMIITLEEGSTIDKVQFYNGIGDNAYPATSIEVVDGEILAGIPNSLLCYANNLTVYLMTIDEDGVKTQEQITLVVNKRAKPEDYIFTDDEFHTYKAYDERLKYLQDNIVLPDDLKASTNAEVKALVPEWARALSPDVTLTEGGKAAEAAKVGAEIENLRKSMSSPYNFKGSIMYSELPTEGNVVNDTYYVVDQKCKYTWNGFTWYQSSMNEAEYQEELNNISEKVDDEFTALSEDLSKIFKKPTIVNYYNKNKSISGKWINNVTQGGTIEDLAYMFYNMVHLPLAGDYYLKYPVSSIGQNNYKLTFYNKNEEALFHRNGVYVSGEGSDTVVKVKLTQDMIDAGVYYLGYTQTVSRVNSLMVCFEQYPSEYIPYNNYLFVPDIRLDGKQIIDTGYDNPFDYKGEEVRIFAKGFFAGDSLTKGTFDHKEKGFTKWEIIQRYSYPTYFGKIFGCDVANWGIGGETTKSWYELVSIDGRAKDYDFAVIALGANDTKINDNAVSKEYYQKIVDMLKSDVNKIKIFCCTVTPAYTETNKVFYESFNDNVVKAIVDENENCYLIDLARYSKCHQNTVYAQGHLTALGYFQQAKEIGSMISYIIAENPSDFKDVQFIGTTFSYS